jgi:5-methylcytosine-specific restriction endonuclease McrA
VESKIKARSRAIPQRIQDRIWLRDQGKCQFINQTTGKRCESVYQIQIDHKKAFALGGSHDEENLRLMCALHNRYLSENIFGARDDTQGSP